VKLENIQKVLEQSVVTECTDTLGEAETVSPETNTELISQGRSPNSGKDNEKFFHPEREKWKREKRRFALAAM